MAPTTSRRRPGAAPYQLPSQSQPLGTWSHSSAAASSPHDPILTLASHVIRTAFGGIVQTVADCLQCRNELSLAQIVSYLQHQHPTKTLSGRTLESTLTTRQIRAALLVLLQHSIVTVKQQQRQISKQTSLLLTKSIYRYHPTAAIHLLRHCRCVEYVRKAAGPDAAGVVQELLVAGRLRTLDLIAVASTAPLEKQGSTATTNEETTSTASVAVVVEESETNGKPNSVGTIIEALGKLVHAGFIQAVEPLTDNTEDEDDDDDGETEFEPARKRAKVSKDTSADATADMGSLRGDPEIVAMLLQYHSQNPTMNIPIDTVWRVNMRMFHETLRAYHLGKLVSERHGHAVPMAGSLVTAALKYRAHVSHSPHWGSSKNTEQHGGQPSTVFSISDVLPYIPKSVRQVWEQKEGDVMVHWHQAWRSLSERTNPQVARRVGDDTFEIALTHLTTYLTDRIIYQVVLDRHGEVAARVASILLKHGYLESERLAETAMVPAKDTREVLHHLFRSRYVELVQLSSSRQYNPANAIYAWGVERTRLRRNITDDVAKALGNVRLRREHEVEVIGKNWMERAQQASDMDENDHEIDQRNYQKFCLGLERLDVAALQLDETLMALCDF
jgi:hypothetical protein